MISGKLDDATLVDQSPIGRSPRSNPVTYLKAFDEIRKTFAASHEAKARKHTASTFSFNVEGGRCSTCEGNGELVIDMQFLADVTMRCPECLGRRYRPEVLEVQYRGKSIADVLDLTAREASGFFRHRPRVQARLRPLLDVGLDYLRLGQPASNPFRRRGLCCSSSPSFLSSTPQRHGSARPAPRPSSSSTSRQPASTRPIPSSSSKPSNRSSCSVTRSSSSSTTPRSWPAPTGSSTSALRRESRGGRIVAEGTPEAVAKSGTATGAVVARTLTG